MPNMQEMCEAGRTTRRGIRLWESAGLLGTVERSAGGTRRYTVEQLNRARIIAACQSLGWSLDYAKTMLTNWTVNNRTAVLLRLNAVIAELPPAAGMEFDL